MHNESDVKPCVGWEVKIARSFEEIEAIREVWMQMHASQPVPALNTDIDRYLSVMESLKEQAEPYVMVLYYDRAPHAILIGRIEKKRIPCRIGYATILKPSLRCLTVVYGGILGQPSEQDSASMFRELIDTLKEGDIDAVFFNQLQLDSLVYDLTRKIPNILCRCYSSVVQPHWQIHG